MPGGGTGLDIDRNIQEAYKFIMWNYEPGDEKRKIFQPTLWELKENAINTNENSRRTIII